MYRFISLFASVTLFAGLLSGCATNSIPNYSKDQAILVLPIKVDNSTPEKWVRNYYVEIVDSSGDLSVHSVPKSDDKYFTIASLSPGTYTLENLTWDTRIGWRTAGGKEKTTLPVQMGFELNPGQLTMLEVEIINLQEDTGGFVTSRFGFEPLEAAYLDTLSAQIKKTMPVGWALN